MTREQTFDVAVIGAGINGAGIARDAALRGLKVIVLDKNDMCSGCSAISSRLIHGGLRYLEHGELPLVYESLHERRFLRLTAPHLVAPLRMCIPIYRGARRGPLLIRVGAEGSAVNQPAIVAPDLGIASIRTIVPIYI